MITHTHTQESGIFVVVPQHSALDRKPQPPGLKVLVSAALDDSDVTATANALRKAAKAVL